MRAGLALVAGGATAGVVFAILPRLNYSNGDQAFGPTITMLLPWVLGIIVWSVVKNSGNQSGGSSSGSEVPAAQPKRPVVQQHSTATAAEDQRMVAKLVELASYYARGGMSTDSPALVSEVVAIGKALNERGGLQEMRRIFEMVPPTQGKRTVEMEWDGIGDWRG